MPGANIPTTEEVQDGLIQAIARLEPFDIKVNNKRTKVTIPESEARYIVRTFFEGFYSMATLSKVCNAIHQYQDQSSGAADSGVPQRCFAAMEKATTPSVIVPLFHAYGNMHLVASLGGQELNRIRENIYRLSLVRIYTSVCKLLDEKSDTYDPDVRRQFQQAGWTTGQGRGWRTCVLDFLEKDIGIPRDQISKRLERATGLAVACQEFGQGFAAVAFETMDTLTDLVGAQKLRKIMPLIHQACPAIAQTARVLEDAIVTPLRDGQKLKDNLVSNTASTTPFIRRLIEYRASEDPEARSASPEV